MSIIESLSLYTSSQKSVAIGFIVAGGFLLLASTYLMFQSALSGPLWQGFKISALIFGLLIAAGGFGYLKFCDKTQTTLVAMYESNQDDMMTFEQQRMQKVVKDFPIYQISFAVIVVIALLIIIFASDFWIGVAFPVAILFISILLIEAHSRTSIVKHFEYIESVIR